MHGRTILSILSFNLVFGQGQVRFSKVSLLTPRLSEVLRIGFLTSTFQCCCFLRIEFLGFLRIGSKSKLFWCCMVSSEPM